MNQVTSSYRKKYLAGLNLFYFDLSDSEQHSRFEDSLKTLAFFEEAKLVVARNVFSSKESAELAKNLLSEHGIGKARSVVVAVVENAPRKDLERTDKNLFKNLASDSTTVRNFEYLSGLKLVNWVRSEFVSRGCSIDGTTGRMLIELAGNESLRLANEIEKLCNYKQNGTVGSGDVKVLVQGRSEMNIFNFVDAVISRNRARAYELLYRELKSGRDTHYLLAMMAYGFRSRASRFSPEELKRAFGKLTEMDILSKNGSVNLGDALFEFVIA